MNQRGCVRCQSAMQIGYLLDRTDNARYSTEWVEGSPEKRFLIGGLKRAPSLPVVSYRCTQCGMLELVAPDPDEAESGQLTMSKGHADKGALSQDDS